MSPEEAYRLLGLQEEASGSNLAMAFHQRQGELDARISSAATPALKAKYESEKERLVAAIDTLASGGGAPGGPPSPPVPSGENLPMIAVEEPVVPEVVLTPTQSEQPLAKRKRRGAKRKGGGAKVFVWLAVLLAAGGGGYYGVTLLDRVNRAEESKQADGSKGDGENQWSEGPRDVGERGNREQEQAATPETVRPEKQFDPFAVVKQSPRVLQVLDLGAALPNSESEAAFKLFDEGVEAIRKQFKEKESRVVARGKGLLGLCSELGYANPFEGAEEITKEQFETALLALANSIGPDRRSISELAGRVLANYCHGLSDRHADFFMRVQLRKGATYNRDHVGVGLGLEYEHGNYYCYPMRGSGPAAKSAIEDGDCLVSVDGVPVQGLLDRDVMNRIRGEADKPVALIYEKKNGELMESVLERRKLAAVELGEDGKTVAIRRILSGRGTAEELRSVLKTLNSTTTLHLDLRGCGGPVSGEFEGALHILDLFFGGKEPLFKYRDLAGLGVLSEGKSRTPVEFPVQTFVLYQDGATRGPAELVIAAIRDLHLGELRVTGSMSRGMGRRRMDKRVGELGILRFSGWEYYSSKLKGWDGVGLYPAGSG